MDDTFDENIYVGVWYDYEDTDIISAAQLKYNIKNKRSVYAPNEYFDRRHSTNIQWFNFDPYTGEPVDIKAVKKYCLND